MKPPIHKLKKTDIEWLADNVCQAHRVSYIAHYNCFLREKPTSPIVERIGFLDIESSNLKASFGYCISYAIKEQDGDLYERVLTSDEIRNQIFDTELLKQFYHDIHGFSRVCVYWGKDRRHDIPFLRTRALKLGIDFPLYREVCVTDLYDWTKNKLSLHNYRLETVCREFGIAAKGHPLTGDIWVRAMSGDSDALQYILEHNREDVLCLEPLYVKLEPFVKNGRISI